MIIERSMDPGWLSNAYLDADEPGGTAVVVDCDAPLESLSGDLQTGGFRVRVGGSRISS